MASNKPCNSGANKVFINPNFNKKLNDQTNHNSSMYINPNFNRQLQLPISLNQVPKPKIHVNPNFIKKTIPLSSGEEQLSYNIKNKIVDVSNNVNTHIKNEAGVLTNPISKSRYHLVRTNKNKVQVDVNKKAEETKKVKINKYKIVSLDIQRNSLNEKNKLEKIKLLTKHKVTALPLRNSFKYTKESHSSGTVKYNSTLVRYKNETRTPKLKVPMKNLKINNIPCPEFRKYGKCLRKIQGNCEFLHDKKHVSICRRFLKGICHDCNCLLSHDLTDKKMPTCFFYLSGMCTKENCPYLHIKLNETAKICADFLKGYCEKGEQCLSRHINICPDLSLKGVCLKKKCPYPHKKRKANEHAKPNARRKEHNLNSNYETKFNIESKKDDGRKEINAQQIDTYTDNRYYKVEQEPGTSESEIVLKPSRCKLGTLPSYIQL